MLSYVYVKTTLKEEIEMKAFDMLKARIENKEFDCEEDAIDTIVRYYKSKFITKEQRAELLKLV